MNISNIILNDQFHYWSQIDSDAKTACKSV